VPRTVKNLLQNGIQHFAIRLSHQQSHFKVLKTDVQAKIRLFKKALAVKGLNTERSNSIKLAIFVIILIQYLG